MSFPAAQLAMGGVRYDPSLTEELRRSDVSSDHFCQKFVVICVYWVCFIFPMKGGEGHPPLFAWFAFFGVMFVVRKTGNHRMIMRCAL